MVHSRSLFVIAGPCAIESEKIALDTAERLATIAERFDIELFYKSSFDKANRTSGDAPRGVGIDVGLRVLQKVRKATGLKVLTDVHETAQVDAVAEAVDVLQIPAFLSRQTDLICAAMASGKRVNVKKGQFMAPADIRHVIAKAEAALPSELGIQDQLMLTERGTSFGHHDLVVDFRGFKTMREVGCPLIFDCTHSVQRPSAANGRSGGDRQHIPALARAAVAAGVDGLFIETHPDPENAASDAATVWPLDQFEALLLDLLTLDELVKSKGMVARDFGAH